VRASPPPLCERRRDAARTRPPRRWRRSCRRRRPGRRATATHVRRRRHLRRCGDAPSGRVHAGARPTATGERAWRPGAPMRVRARLRAIPRAGDPARGRVRRRRARRRAPPRPDGTASRRRETPLRERAAVDPAPSTRGRSGGQTRRRRWPPARSRTRFAARCTPHNAGPATLRARRSARRTAARAESASRGSRGRTHRREPHTQHTVGGEARRAALLRPYARTRHEGVTGLWQSSKSRAGTRSARAAPAPGGAGCRLRAAARDRRCRATCREAGTHRPARARAATR